MRILFVEDDPSFTRLIAKLASRQGHEWEAVETVADAKYVLREQDFDLVTLDLGLPDGDGLEVVQEILAVQRKDLPIAVITGERCPDLQRCCEELGLALIDKGVGFLDAFDRMLERLDDHLAAARRA